MYASYSEESGGSVEDGVTAHTSASVRSREMSCPGASDGPVHQVSRIEESMRSLS
jgi:hypothetical protein